MSDGNGPADVCAVVLAAGAGSRFGGAKQVVEVGGVPMVLRAVRAARHPAVGRVIVVVGCHADAVRSVLADEDVDVVEAPDWSDGLGRSVSAGMQAVTAGQAAIVLLADQPGITAAVVERVLTERDVAADATRASFGGVPGHPVLVEGRLVPELRDLHGDRGAASMLSTCDVRLVPCDDIGDGRDVDYPGDV